jgi:hypothetical protein
MKVLDIVRYLLIGSKAKVAAPTVAATPISSIVFPQEYQDVSLYHTIPAATNTNLLGSQFGQSIINVPATQQRDDMVYQQCAAGNVPGWMRDFKAITVQEKSNTLTYFVSPDVLCIGNGNSDDTDFLRVSLNGYTAKRVVDLFGCLLPTKKIADQIWQAADLKLMPQTMGGNYQMITTQTLMDHNSVIEKQRAGRNFNIITGHKKDIVSTNHLLVDRTRLAIYGWFYPTGQAIQGPTPNSASHDVNYQDYSSSIRLVSRQAILNQQAVNLYDVLNSKDYAYLISDEGTMNARAMYMR